MPSLAPAAGAQMEVRRIHGLAGTSRGGRLSLVALRERNEKAGFR